MTQDGLLSNENIPGTVQKMGQHSCSVDDAAAALGIGRDALYRGIRRADIPAVIVGRYRLIPRWWLEQKLAQLREPPTHAS